MLSIDAGRPATMSYSFQQHSQLPSNMLANGFGASRGKPDSINNIPIPTLPTISASLYDDPNALFPTTPTARTSGRAQLLAGLRTAPKTPTSIEHGTYGQSFDGELQSDSPQAGPGHLNFLMNRNERAFGHDSTRNQVVHPPQHQHAMRPSLPQDHFHNIQFNSFSGLPTPPTSSHYIYQGDQDYETKAYADILARNISLAQQQQQHFVQQLRIAQQAQQLQHLHHQMQPLQMQSAISQSLGTPPISPAVYSPTASSHPSLHHLYNTNGQKSGQGYTSQQNRAKHVVFPAMAQPEQTFLASLTSQLRISPSPPLARPTARTPSRSTPSPTKDFAAAASSSVKKTPSPPPTSMSTFRRGHKKCISLSGCTNNMGSALADGGPKTSIPRLSNVPSTPLNSTFGGRGDHPIRQPRGPPALEEVIAKPTAKHEGSKNFSSRQRRRALTKLVNAGLERRGTKQAGSPSSSMMPVSEHDAAEYPLEADVINHAVRKETILDNSLVYRSEGRRTPRRTGLAAPHLAAHNAEKRRSAVF